MLTCVHASLATFNKICKPRSARDLWNAVAIFFEPKFSTCSNSTSTIKRCTSSQGHCRGNDEAFFRFFSRVLWVIVDERRMFASDPRFRIHKKSGEQNSKKGLVIPSAVSLAWSTALYCRRAIAARREFWFEKLLQRSRDRAHFSVCRSCWKSLVKHGRTSACSVTSIVLCNSFCQKLQTKEFN